MLDADLHSLLPRRAEIGVYLVCTAAAAVSFPGTHTDKQRATEEM